MHPESSAPGGQHPAEVPERTRFFRDSASTAPLRLALILGALGFAATDAQAISIRVAQVPNGGQFSCSLCHLNPRGGGARTIFGEDSRHSLTGRNVNWPPLCALDSDGDGFTNGQELGDADCNWQRGAAVDGPPTNPSDPNDFPRMVVDAGVPDASPPDAAAPDAAGPDAPGPDATEPDEGGAPDAQRQPVPDAGARDAAPPADRDVPRADGGAQGGDVGGVIIQGQTGGGGSDGCAAVPGRSATLGVLWALVLVGAGRRWWRR